MAPWSSTFLSLTSTSFIFHSLFFNFLPLYLLIISCDDCFEDCTTKYRNILISKWGKKDYVITNITKSFCISFFLILFTLLLNMLMSEIIFNTATYSIFSENLVDEDKTSLFYIEATHPTVTNIIYIFTTSLLSGAIGAAGAALAMAIKIRKIVYPRITTVLRIWLRYENTRICHNSRNFCSIDNRCGDKRGALCKNLSIPLQSMLWYRHWLCLLWFFCGFFSIGVM